MPSFAINQHNTPSPNNSTTSQPAPKNNSVVGAVKPNPAVLAAVTSAQQSASKPQTFEHQLQKSVDAGPVGQRDKRASIASNLLLAYQQNSDSFELTHFELGRQGEQAVDFIKAAGQLQRLQTLNLKWSRLGDLGEHAKGFSEGLGQLAELQTLDLSANHLGNLGKEFEAFADGLSNLAQLQTLSLRMNDLGNLGKNIKGLAEGLAQLPQLKSLDLRKNFFEKNERVAYYLDHALSQLPSLVEFKIDDYSLFPKTRSAARLRVKLHSLNIQKDADRLLLNNVSALRPFTKVAERCETVSDLSYMFQVVIQAYNQGSLGNQKTVQHIVNHACCSVMNKIGEHNPIRDVLKDLKKTAFAELLYLVEQGNQIGLLAAEEASSLIDQIQIKSQVGQAYNPVESAEDKQQLSSSQLTQSQKSLFTVDSKPLTLNPTVLTSNNTTQGTLKLMPAKSPITAAEPTSPAQRGLRQTNIQSDLPLVRTDSSSSIDTFDSLSSFFSSKSQNSAASTG